MAYGFRYNKTPGRSPGKRSYTPEDMKRVGWCMNKNIKIAVIPNGNKFRNYKISKF